MRSGLLNNPSSGQDAQLLLQAFLKIKSHILAIRREQAKLLETIDQVSTVFCHPSTTTSVPITPDVHCFE